MKILFYDAGALGGLCATRLHDAGHDVPVLAHGRRLAELEEYGVDIGRDVYTEGGW